MEVFLHVHDTKVTDTIHRDFRFDGPKAIDGASRCFKNCDLHNHVFYLINMLYSILRKLTMDWLTPHWLSVLHLSNRITEPLSLPRMTANFRKNSCQVTRSFGNSPPSGRPIQRLPVDKVYLGTWCRNELVRNYYSESRQRTMCR